MQLSQVKTTMLRPRNAMMAGAALYGLLVLYMTTRYRKTSPVQKVFHDAGEEWDSVKVLHPPGKQ